MKVYIAGPMTGLPEFNYPAFYRAAHTLGQAGIDTINPARTEGRVGCRDWLDYMRASLRDIADCDGIATLPGWGESRGAALEVHIARSLDLPVKSVTDWVDDQHAAAYAPIYAAQVAHEHEMRLADEDDWAGGDA